MTGRGWAMAGNTVATAVTLLLVPMALAGLYFLGVQAVLWIAHTTQ